MTKSKSFLLSFILTFSPFSIFAIDNFEFNFKISSAEYSSDQGLLNFQTETQVGTLSLQRLFFNSDEFYFDMKDENGIDLSLSADSKKFYFTLPNQKAGTKLENVNALHDIKYFNVKNLSTSLDKDSFFLDQEKFIYKLSKNRSFEFQNFTFDCPFDENLEFDSTYSKVLYYCLNGASLQKSNSQLSTPYIIATNDKTRFETKVDDFKTTKNDISANGSLLKINTQYEHSQADIEIESFKVYCHKKVLSNATFIDLLIEGCYENILLESQDFAVVYQDIKNAKDTNLNLKKGVISSDNKQLSLKGDHFSLSQESFITNIENITAKCLKISLKKKITDRVIEDCLASTNVKASKLSFHNLENKSRTNITSLDFSLLPDYQSTFLASNINYSSNGRSQFNINNISARCSRPIITSENLDFDLLLRGCFNSSTIKIQSIDYSNPTSELKMNISSVSLDRNKINIKVPKANYVLDKINYSIKQAEYLCNLSASFDVVKNKNWRKILANCFRDLTLTIKDSEISKGKIKKYQDLIIRVKNNVLSMNINIQTRTLISLRGKVAISGKVYFEKNNSVMVIDVKNKKIKILGVPFFTQAIFKTAIQSLVKSEYITEVGSKIKIDFSKMEVNNLL